MNIFNYKVLMHRTLKNLDYVKENDPSEPDSEGRSPPQKDVPPYAVTQRVNSFLGAFAHAYDHTLGKEFKQQSNGTHGFSPIRSVPADWPAFQESRTLASSKQIPEPDNLGERCRHMRNAMAHGNVKFEANGQNEIIAIHLWTNSQQGRGPIDWAAALSVSDFELLLRRFCTFVDATFDDEGNAK
jgi:hypothetical protein